MRRPSLPGFLFFVIGLLTLVQGKTAVGQDLATITYDAETDIYYIGDSAGLTTVYPDGHSEIWNSLFRPRKGLSPSPSTAFVSQETPFGKIITSGNPQEFLRLHSDGTYQAHAINDEGLVPCPQEMPGDRCLAYAFFYQAGHYFSYAFHSRLDLIFYQWDGQKFGPLQAPFAQLGTDQIIDILLQPSSFSGSLGRGQPTLLISPFQYAQAANISLLFDDQYVKQKLDFEASSEISVYLVSGLRVVGKDAFLTLANTKGKLGAYRLHLEGHQLIQTSIVPQTQAKFPWTSWVGMDADGFAYGYNSDSKRLGFMNLSTGEIKDLGLCPDAKALPSFHEAKEPSLWITCGSEVWSLRSGAKDLRWTAPSTIFQAYVTSLSGEPFSALVITGDHRTQRIRGAQEQPVENIDLVRAPADSTVLAWNDGLRLCRDSQPPIMQNVIRCLEGQEWKLQADYPLPLPLDIMETEHFTWYAAEKDAQIKVWRRGRGVQDTWHIVDADAPAPGSDFVRFFPTTEKDRVGLMGSGLQLKVFGPAAEISSLPIANRDLYPIRVALDAEGWLYGACPPLPPLPALFYRACSFSPEGQKHDFEELAKGGLRLSTEAFFPLTRGALMMPANKLAMILHHDKSIPLAVLYGEFKSSQSRGLDLDIWSSGQGSVFIQKKHSGEDDDSPLLRTVYQLDGSRLKSLQVEPYRNPFDTGLFSSGSSNSGPVSRYPQVWQDQNGLWMRPKLLKAEFPLLSGASLPELLRPQKMDFNTIHAAAVAGDQAVLATDLGLWFCPFQGAQIIGPDTARINRSQGCRLDASQLPAHQILNAGGEELVLLAGSKLYRYSLSRQMHELMIGGIESPRVWGDDDFLLYAKGQELKRFSLSSGEESLDAALPLGLSGRDLKVFDAQHICSDSGFFVKASAGDWDRKAGSCRAAVSRKGEFWAVAGHELWWCRDTSCHVQGVVPGDERAQLTLGYEDALVMASGRQVWRWSGTAWNSCEAPWALGPLPLSDAKKIDDGIILSSGSGAIQGLCSGRPQIFRLY